MRTLETLIARLSADDNTRGREFEKLAKWFGLIAGMQWERHIRSTLRPRAPRRLASWPALAARRSSALPSR
jgi:hypothetical protein